MVLLTALVLSGCALIDWIAPEPVVPVVTAVANVDAVLVGNDVAWTIENIGSVDIVLYIITFDVEYPVVRDNVIITVEGYDLEVGEKHSGTLVLDLHEDTAPTDVSVTWELFN